MAGTDLIDGLQVLGYEVRRYDVNGQVFLSFPFVIRAGRFAGTTVSIGLQAGSDWPINPPSGPHVSPPLLPQQNGGSWPHGGIHDGRLAPFMDASWQYWSRPFPGWAQSPRSAAAYVEHLHHMFDAIQAGS
jgi:hypothetical protein